MPVISHVPGTPIYQCFFRFSAASLNPGIPDLGDKEAQKIRLGAPCRQEQFSSKSTQAAIRNELAPRCIVRNGPPLHNLRPAMPLFPRTAGLRDVRSETLASWRPPEENNGLQATRLQTRFPSRSHGRHPLHRKTHRTKPTPLHWLILDVRRPWSILASAPSGVTRPASDKPTRHAGTPRDETLDGRGASSQVLPATSLDPRAQPWCSRSAGGCCRLRQPACQQGPRAPRISGVRQNLQNATLVSNRAVAPPPSAN